MNNQTIEGNAPWLDVDDYINVNPYSLGRANHNELSARSLEM